MWNIEITNYDRDGLQSAIGLKFTKYDRAGLQITIGFGLQSVTKFLKIELQSAMGLQYKVWQVWITNSDGLTKRNRLQSDTVQKVRVNIIITNRDFPKVVFKKNRLF